MIGAYPGGIDTDMLAGVEADKAAKADPQVVAARMVAGIASGTPSCGWITGARHPRSDRPTIKSGNRTAHPGPAVPANGHRPWIQNGGEAEHAATGRGLLHDANLIYQAAAASGERLSQRTLARQLRGHSHRSSNQHLHGIAASIGLTPGPAA